MVNPKASQHTANKNDSKIPSLSLKRLDEPSPSTHSKRKKSQRDWNKYVSTQQPDIDFNETFAPVSCMDKIRTLWAITAQNKWHVYQTDVKSTFLNSYLDEWSISRTTTRLWSSRTRAQCIHTEKGTIWFEAMDLIEVKVRQHSSPKWMIKVTC